MSNRIQRAKRARRGDRSFQPSGAGKGDADRTTDKEAFDRNYDEIDWGRPKFSGVAGQALRQLPVQEVERILGVSRDKWDFDWSADQ